MRKNGKHFLFILCLCSFLIVPAFSLAPFQTVERSDVPDKYLWDLSDLFSSDDAWMEAKDQVEEMIKTLPRFQGVLTESSSGMLECLAFRDEINMQIRRLSSYSWNKSRLDLREPKYRAMDRELNNLVTRYNAAASFIEPELSGMDESVVRKFIASMPGLKPYAFYLSDLIRRKTHTLPAGEERLAAEAGRMSLGPASIYRAINNTELAGAEAELSTGETILLDRAGFRRHRGSINGEDRQLVFKTYYGALKKYRPFFGTLMDAKVNVDLFNARSRGFSDCLERVLYPNDIPVSVFHNLIDGANSNLDKFHRYLNIRKRLLGVDGLEYTHLSVSALGDIDRNYDLEEAKELILEALEPLGEGYLSSVKKAFESRWIDFFPTPGKRSNGYTDPGAYAEHPFILLNYGGSYSDVATLIHELGHLLHRYLTDRSQPFPLSNYPSFLAEVASTLNEKLLRHHLLKQIKDDKMRLYLLLTGLERTIFDQAQISEFELRIHQAVENGEVLTGDSISGIYLETLRKYYGHDSGICFVPDYVDMEWIFERLLFVNTYRIYVYATSLTAVIALAERAISGDRGAVEKYLELLSAGGSDYPIDLLKRAGVDMHGQGAFEETMASMSKAMDEIDMILDRLGK